MHIGILAAPHSRCLCSSRDFLRIPRAESNTYNLYPLRHSGDAATQAFRQGNAVKGTFALTSIEAYGVPRGSTSAHAETIGLPYYVYAYITPLLWRGLIAVPWNGSSALAEVLMHCYDTATTSPEDQACISWYPPHTMPQ